MKIKIKKKENIENVCRRKVPYPALLFRFLDNSIFLYHLITIKCAIVLMQFCQIMESELYRNGDKMKGLKVIYKDFSLNARKIEEGANVFIV